MVKNSDGLLRLFWPNTITDTTTSGVIVGWRNSDLDLFVVTVLEDAESKLVERALLAETLFRGSPYPMVRIYDLCSRSSLSVLGTFNQADSSNSRTSSWVQVHQIHASEAISVTCNMDAVRSTQIIYYTPPDPTQLQYISLEPIDLTLGQHNSHVDSTGGHDETATARLREEQAKRLLVEKLRFHTVVRRKPTQKELVLPAIVRQINCARELAVLLQRNTPFARQHRKRQMSVGERVVESAHSLYSFAAWSLWTLFMTYAWPALSYTIKVAIIWHRILAEGLLQCLEAHLPVTKLDLSGSTSDDSEYLSMKDVSGSCQQIHLRLQQFSYYPIQYTVLRRRHATWSSVTDTNADYIRFYNSLWLVANDVILGIAIGSFINDNVEYTARFVSNFLTTYTIDGLSDTIRWLSSYPGGLKLNTELADFLSDLFLWVIQYWAAMTRLVILPYLPQIVSVLGLAAFAGASMPIAIFSDFLTLTTVHIYAFYVASARIFNWQLSIIVSLFHLFRGKKRNVLRNRIDNCDYDLDQLLLGTILFTLLFFLLPTVVVFYITFASARMAIITIKAILDTCLAFLNHFPLFALMLKVKDSRRLPGGVHFELLSIHSTWQQPILSTNVVDADSDSDESTPTTNSSPSQAQFQSSAAHVKLSSTSLSIRHIFEQYFELGSRIRRHYFSPKVAFRLMTGQFVPPLGRSEMYGMQYSVLPRDRASVSEVWNGLFEHQSATGGDSAR